MKEHRFTIKAGLCSRDSTIELDGVQLIGVVRVAFELKANGLTTLSLDVVGEVLVEGEFRESAILSVRQNNVDRLR